MKFKKPNIDTTNLKRQLEENPLVALGIGAAILNGSAKLLKTSADNRNSKTWKKEVKRRTEAQKNRK